MERPIFCHGMPADLGFPNTATDLISPHHFTPLGPNAAPSMVVDGSPTGTSLQAGPPSSGSAAGLKGHGTTSIGVKH